MKEVSDMGGREMEMEREMEMDDGRWKWIGRLRWERRRWRLGSRWNGSWERKVELMRNTEVRMQMEMESSGYQQQQRSILATNSSAVSWLPTAAQYLGTNS